MARSSATSVTPGGRKDMGEEIFGDGNTSTSISENYQPVLQRAVFMTGLRFLLGEYAAELWSDLQDGEDTWRRAQHVRLQRMRPSAERH